MKYIVTRIRSLTLSQGSLVHVMLEHKHYNA